MADATVQPVLTLDAAAAAAAAALLSQRDDQRLRSTFGAEFCRNSASFAGDVVGVGGGQSVRDVVEERSQYADVASRRYPTGNDVEYDARSDDEAVYDVEGIN